jgi:preprotein translocase subunit SecG
MILYYAIATLHVIVCVILVLVVLLQSGKGADLAGAFGGGATQTAFGSRGPASFLSKMTTIAAVVFMITSIALSMISTKKVSKSVLETIRQQSSQPVKNKPAAPPIAVPSRDQILRQQEAAESAKQKQPATPSAPAQAPTPEKQPAPKPTDTKAPAK